MLLRGGNMDFWFLCRSYSYSDIITNKWIIILNKQRRFYRQNYTELYKNSESIV